MIGVGGSDWKHYLRRKPHVVKRRIRKGIPDCLRGLVWQLISGSRDLLLMNPGVYEVIKLIYWMKNCNILCSMISACHSVILLQFSMSPINMNWRVSPFSFAHFSILCISVYCYTAATTLDVLGFLCWTLSFMLMHRSKAILNMAVYTNKKIWSIDCSLTAPLNPNFGCLPRRISLYWIADIHWITFTLMVFITLPTLLI